MKAMDYLIKAREQQTGLTTIYQIIGKLNETQLSKEGRDTLYKMAEETQKEVERLKAKAKNSI